MNRRFKRLIASLEPSFRQLMAMKPVHIDFVHLPKNAPKAGVYLLSDRRNHLYVGRSSRLRARLLEHCRPSARHRTASFAFRLAMETINWTGPTYRRDGAGSRSHLAQYADTLVTSAKVDIREMDLRYVEERDPLRQVLLEIYVAVALRTSHNTFGNSIAAR